MKLLKRLILPQSLLLPLSTVALLTGSHPSQADSYSATVLADNPAAYYRMEEAPGESTLVDSSASGTHSGTYTSLDGIYPKLGKPGISTNSAFFHAYKDSSGTQQYSYAEVPYSAELNPSGPFTAEAWVRVASFNPTDYRSPVSAFGGWNDSSGWFFYQSPASSGQSVWVWVQKGGSIWLQASTPVQKLEWTHLVGAYDGKMVRFYINGVLIGSTDASTALPNSGQPLRIGARDLGYGYFDGNVDEVAIYTTCLSSNQIVLHYQVGLTNISNRPVAPEVIQDPAPITVAAGKKATFTVGTDGTAPLAYQWYKGSAPLQGETTDTLSFTAALAEDGTSYKVVVTNLYGSATSAAATLTVSKQMTLDANPASITRTVGSKAAFLVVAGGAGPFGYQWYKGASPIPGATNQTLWLSRIQPADDGSTYYAHVSSPWSSTNSEPATLTVSARAVEVPITGYAKTVAADDPVAYWRLDEEAGSTVAVDAVGSFDGEYSPGQGSFTYGVNTAIPSETNKAVSVTGGARISVPYALELNPRGPFTAEGWFMPASLGANGEDYRTVFSSMGSGPGGTGPNGWLLYQQPNNTFTWVVFNEGWVSSFIGDPVDTVAANSWYHIALTYDGSLFRIYVNGQQTVASPFDLFIPNQDGASNFGWRSDNDWKPFDGVIDDVAFYNKALSPDQVLFHYTTSVRLAISRSGDKLILSWPSGALQEADKVEGSYTNVPNATSPMTITPGAAKFYRVKM